MGDVESGPPIDQDHNSDGTVVLHVFAAPKNYK